MKLLVFLSLVILSLSGALHADDVAEDQTEAGIARDIDYKSPDCPCKVNQTERSAAPKVIKATFDADMTPRSNQNQEHDSSAIKEQGA